MGAHDFKHNMVSLFCLKTSEYLCFDVCCPETSAFASKPILLRCCQQIFITVICSIHMLISVQSFIRIEEVQRGAHGFKLKKVPLFARKPVNINVLWSASTKLALEPANPYNCDI